MFVIGFFVEDHAKALRANSRKRIRVEILLELRKCLTRVSFQVLPLPKSIERGGYMGVRLNQR